jgi:hypothetical protein
VLHVLKSSSSSSSPNHPRLGRKWYKNGPENTHYYNLSPQLLLLFFSFLFSPFSPSFTVSGGCVMGLFWGVPTGVTFLWKRRQEIRVFWGAVELAVWLLALHTLCRTDGRWKEGGRFKDERGHARLQSILRLACKASRRLGKLVCNVTWHPNWGQVFRKDEKYNLVLALHISSSKSNTVTLTIEFRLRRSFSLFFANKILAVQQRKRKEIGPFQPSKNGLG